MTVLVLKKMCTNQDISLYTIHYEGKSCSSPRTQKGFASYFMHFSSFKICSQFYLNVSHFTSHFFAKTLT